MATQLWKREDVRIGQVYTHGFLQKDWNIRITSFDQDDPALWIGVLVGDQGGLEDGCKVWGRIHELRDAQH